MNGRLGTTSTRFYKTQEIRYCRQVIDEGVNLWIKTFFSKFLCLVLFMMLYKAVLTSRWMKPSCVTIQMKAIEQYFHMVLFIMLYKAVLTLKLWMCDHSNESR